MKNENFAAGLKGLAHNKTLLIALVIAVGTIAALATFASEGGGYGRIKAVAKTADGKKIGGNANAYVDCVFPKGSGPYNGQPSYQPSYQPTYKPSAQPTYVSTAKPKPSYQPSYQPTYAPGKQGSNTFSQTLFLGADNAAVSNPIPAGSKCTVTMYVPKGYTVTNAKSQKVKIAKKKNSQVTFKVKKDNPPKKQPSKKKK